MRLSIPLLVICTFLGIGNCLDCNQIQKGEVLKASTLKIDEYLLGSVPDAHINARMDLMDTMNCFEVKRRDGSSSIGKLRRSKGFGLSKYEFHHGGRSEALSIEKIVEISELKIDLKKLEKRLVSQTEPRSNPVFIVVCVLALGFAFMYLISGAVFAGGK